MRHPPFCPNPECPYHDRSRDFSGQVAPFGTYRSQAKGVIRRYRCRVCSRTFSDQTFELDYYAKRIVDYQALMRLLVGCTSLRHMGRILGVDTRTVGNRIGRLARQAMSIHSEQLADSEIAEDLVADGFESFCVSQYFPNNIHILAGKRSQFIYHLNYTTIRRKGRMREAQRRRREALEQHFRAEPSGIRKHFGELLDVLARLAEHSGRAYLILYTDKKYQYASAWTAHRGLAGLAARVHLAHVQIDSTAHRALANPLFSVNYLDRELRKDLADHVRETTRFARNVCDCMNRLAVYRLWHNLIKPYRIGGASTDEPRHCDVAGLPRSRREAELATLYTRRRFHSHQRGLTRSDSQLWFRRLETPLKQSAEYLPAYAVA